MSIPKKLMQFWHASRPADVHALMETWRFHNPDFEYHFFDSESAERYLLRHHDAGVLRAYRSAALPAMASDIFRVAWCAVEGGVYVDAGTECLAPLSSWLPEDVTLLLVRKWHGAIWNGFFAARPDAPQLRAALDRIIANVDARASQNVWEVTGPGVLRDVIDESDAHVRILPQKQVQSRLRMAQDLEHKRTDHWSQAQKTMNIFKDPDSGAPPSPAISTEPAVTNELEVQFFGLQRSGNHAVLAWLFRQYESPQHFCNNVDHFADPFTRGHFAKVPNTIQITHRDQVDRPHWVEAQRRAHKRLLVVSYENLAIGRLGRIPPIPDHDATVGLSRRIRRVLLLRDYFNWMSSRLKLIENRALPNPDPQRTIVGLSASWQTYAEEFVGETAHLGPDAVYVDFLRWTRDAPYRRSLLDALGVPQLHDDVSYVPDVGGGSSFDSTAFSGSADRMQLRERAKLLSDEARRNIDLALEAAPRIVELNERIFGEDGRRPW